MSVCHLCHVCPPCHHDTEGGGGHRVCRDTRRDMGKLPFPPSLPCCAERPCAFGYALELRVNTRFSQLEVLTL